MPVGLESGREKGGLTWECEGLFRGRAGTPSPLARPDLQACVHSFS